MVARPKTAGRKRKYGKQAERSRDSPRHLLRPYLQRAGGYTASCKLRAPHARGMDHGIAMAWKGIGTATLRAAAFDPMVETLTSVHPRARERDN